MLKKPPLHPTDLQPEDIVGHDFLVIFERHFKQSLGCQGDFDKGMRGFNQQNRDKITRIYEKLRAHGFYPRGMNEYDSIAWSVVTTNNPFHFELIEDDTKNFTREEILGMRKKHNENLEKFLIANEIPRVNADDLQFEDDRF